MSLLDQAVKTIESWGPERAEERTRCIELFTRCAGRMDRGIEIWEAFLENAPESGDRYTAVLWIGAESARRLQALYLENKTDAAELTTLTGVRFKDSLSLDEDLDIVQPYEQLRPGETGGERAASAIRTLTERRQNIDAAVAALAG